MGQRSHLAHLQVNTTAKVAMHFYGAIRSFFFIDQVGVFPLVSLLHRLVLSVLHLTLTFVSIALPATEGCTFRIKHMSMYTQET